MPDKFSRRSHEKELMDEPHIPKSLIYQNLYELSILNRSMAGHSITISGIKKLVTDKNKIYRIVDLGCGGGDTLQCIADWAAAQGFKVLLTGVDKNPIAINYLTERCHEYPEIHGIVGDYQDFLRTEEKIDIILCALFCHHLRDEELVELFKNLKNRANIGFIINDLQRHFLAYHGVKLLTQVLRASPLAKNDGPLSVLRGFKKKELQELLQKTELQRFSIQWKWPFRYLVVVRNGK